MRFINKLRLSLVVCVSLFGLIGTSPALAATNQSILPGNGSNDVCSSGSSASSSAVCGQAQNKDNPLTGCPDHCGHGILNDATNIVAIVAGSAAIIIMIVGALRFATSGSDVSTSSRTDTDIENARRSIVSAAVGLVVIVLARFIIDFVLSKL